MLNLSRTSNGPVRPVLVGLILLTGLNTFLAFNRHSHNPRFTYHSELWADRGGYFVYLPAVFEYGFQSNAYPAGLDTLAGDGFSLGSDNGVLRIKYTSGVAIMLSPVYWIAHRVGRLLGADVSAFGAVDHGVVDIAAGLYLSIGLWCMFLLLRTRTSTWAMIMAFAGIYLGSNLFYYTIADPGMSHVYSFSLFSAFLLVVFRRKAKGTIGNSLLIGAIAALILLIRPTNIAFLLCAPFVVVWLRSTALMDLIKTVGVWDLMAMLVTALLVWLPQLWYWDLAFGSALTWPYTGESFSNAAAPELLKFWFSTNNGAFLYAPILFLILIAAAVVWKEGGRDLTIATIGSFAMVSFMGASWWVWHFGCGFGSRTLVEYMAVFVFPLAVGLDGLRSKQARRTATVGVVICAAAVLKMVYSYGGCWFHGDWNWAAFADLLFGPTK